MRIGLVLPRSPGYSETFFRSKIAGLSQKGYKFILFVDSDGGERIDDVVIKKAFPVPSSLLFKGLLIVFILLRLLVVCPKRTYKLYKLQRSEGFSVLTSMQTLYLNAHILPHNLDWLHFGFATMGVKRENLSRAMNAKSAVSLRGFDISIYPLKHPGCYDLLWKRIDKVHVLSDELIEKMKDTGGRVFPPVHKITPAIRVSDFLQNKTGYFHSPVRILTVGRLHWIKGYEYGIKAMAELKNHFNITFHWSIIGSGAEFERLKFAIYQMNLEDCISIRGHVSHQEVSEEMSAADIYLQPSIHEGFCNAVLEAQAAGCFCIVTEVGGLKENVLDKVTGRSVPARNPAAIANVIAQVINMPERSRAGIIGAAQKRVEQDFTIESQIDKFQKFYSNA